MLSNGTTIGVIIGGSTAADFPSLKIEKNIILPCKSTYTAVDNYEAQEPVIQYHVTKKKEGSLLSLSLFSLLSLVIRSILSA